MPTHIQCAALAIDAGGTYFKSALVSSTGALVEAPAFTEVDSDGSAEALLSAYGMIIERARTSLRQQGIRWAGIGVSTPGPFDYARCTSLMTHKFSQLRGLDLRQALRDRFAFLREVPVRFIHDGHAFILGEYWRGAAQGYNRVAGVTLGTGIGFGAVVNGHIQDDGMGGPWVSLYQRPCRDGILEDVASARGILRLYREKKSAQCQDKEERLDVAEIARRALAAKADQDAVSVFYEVGSVLGEHLSEVAASLNIESFIFGGQIAKSFSLLRPGLTAGLQGEVELCPAKLIDEAALAGATYSLLRP